MQIASCFQNGAPLSLISPHGASAGAPVHCFAGHPAISHVLWIWGSCNHLFMIPNTHPNRANRKGVDQDSHGMNLTKSPPSWAAGQLLWTATDELIWNYSKEQNVWFCDHHDGWTICGNSNFHRIHHTGHGKSWSDWICSSFCLPCLIHKINLVI